MTNYLDIRDLTLIASRLLNCNEPPVRDWGLLESAAMRPRTTVFGADAYPTLHDKVAALVHSIARNHALIDGNKRLAFMAGYMMYALNGYELVPPDPSEGDAFFRAIAKGELEVADIAKTLMCWTHKRHDSELPACRYGKSKSWIAVTARRLMTVTQPGHPQQSPCHTKPARRSPGRFQT